MEWPKLKNIILIILAATNLCLLVFVAQRELRDSYSRRQARSEAIQFLADRAVTVSEDQIPDDMALVLQMVERDLEGEGEAAAQLLGSRVQAEDRGGGVYRYFNDLGSIQFHSDGSFSAQFVSGAFPVEGEETARCLEMLQRLGFTGELVEADGDSMTFRQLWDGRPLFNQQVTLEIEDGCLTAMTAGRRLVGDPVQDLSQPPISAVTALIDLLNGINRLGDVCSRVDAIVPGYVAATALSGPMTLTPVWRVTTDTGSYQLDMMTGELGRVDPAQGTVVVRQDGVRAADAA